MKIFLNMGPNILNNSPGDPLFLKSKGPSLRTCVFFSNFRSFVDPLLLQQSATWSITSDSALEKRRSTNAKKCLLEILITLLFLNALPYSPGYTSTRLNVDVSPWTKQASCMALHKQWGLRIIGRCVCFCQRSRTMWTLLHDTFTDAVANAYNRLFGQETVKVADKLYITKIT